jgi:hypothetical protein
MMRECMKLNMAGTFESSQLDLAPSQLPAVLRSSEAAILHVSRTADIGYSA